MAPSAAGRGSPTRATRRFGPRSSGATTCLIRRNSGRSGPSPCSWAVSTPTPRWQSRPGSRSTCSRGSWTSRWSWPARPRGDGRATGCSKPSTSTPRSCSWPSGELDGVRERHLRHFSAVAEELELGWPPFVTGALLDERRPDYENVRAALEWSAESDPCAGLRLFAATRDLFQILAQADGRRIAQLLLQRCPARDRCRVEVLITAGILAMATANAQASRAFHSEAQR